MQYLGLEICSREMVSFVLEKKILKLSSCCLLIYILYARCFNYRILLRRSTKEEGAAISAMREF